jgi:UDPglucose 6-dehydrogenase
VNPEFLREGVAVHDFFHPDRFLFGIFDAADATELRQLYQDTKAPVITTDPRTAELAKLAANVFLATRISFINEIASICQGALVDVDPVIETLGLDPRLGACYLSPGIGFGGSCLPKDLAAICHFAESTGSEAPLLRQVEATNDSMAVSAVEVIRSGLGGLAHAHIAVWGLTFKGGTNDLRASPALEVVRLLNEAGANVTGYDPAIGEDDATGVSCMVAGDPVLATLDADCLAVLTDWPQFREVDFARVRDALLGNFVFDGRNLLDRARVEAAGLRYQGVGRPLTGTGAKTASDRIEGWK